MVGILSIDYICTILYPHSRFYVNTEAKPPTTTWIHPSGPVSTPSPEPRYSPPPMAPPVNSSNYAGDYNQTRSGGQGGYPGYGGANNNYGDPRSEYDAEGYEQNHPQQRGLGIFISIDIAPPFPRNFVGATGLTFFFFYRWFTWPPHGRRERTRGSYRT